MTNTTEGARAPAELEGLTRWKLEYNAEYDSEFMCPTESGGYFLATDVERLLATLAAPEEAANWQPIETAPKHGTEVLLYLGAPWERVAKARWYAAWANWQEGEFPAAGDEYCGIGSGVPTHWMPLPAAPGSAPQQVAQASRNDVLEEAAQICEAERVEDTGTDGDTGYNNAITHAAAAIRALKDAPAAASSTETGEASDA